MTIPQQNKGTNLELRAAAYFQAHGFLVRRGVTLAVAAGTAEATDIDVYALRYSLPLVEERVIADCKDKRKSKPFERILWTRGLATFAKATKAIVVLPNAPWQAREFASSGEIEIITPSDIEGYLQSIGSPRVFGEADPALVRRFDACKQITVDQNKAFLQQELGLRQTLISGHALTNFNKIVRFITTLGKLCEQGTGESRWLRKYMVFDAAVVACVMLVRFAIESKWTPGIDWKAHASKRLTYGDMPAKKAKELAKMALGANFTDGLPEPPYTEEIIQVIELLIAQSHIAYLAPYSTDFLLFGRTIGGIEDNYQVPSLGSAQEQVFKICRRVLSALAYAAELKANIWDSPTAATTAHSNSTDQVAPVIPLQP